MGSIGEDYQELWTACGRRALEGFKEFGRGRSRNRDRQAGNQQFEIKDDKSLVTETDKAVEKLLGEEFDQPDRGLRMIGEETVEQRGEDYIQQALAGSVWIVDPIDGTAPFANGFPQWGISAARADGGCLTEGILYFPAFPEGESNLFWSKEGGVWAGRLDPYSGVLKGALPMPSPENSWNGGRMISLSQKRARRGKLHAPNPVQSNGACIYSFWGLMTGRYGAYLGDFKLWDAAAGWILASRLGLQGFFIDDQKIDSGGGALPFNRSLGNDSPYRMEGDGRWHVRGPVLFYQEPEAKAVLLPELVSAANPA